MPKFFTEQMFLHMYFFFIFIPLGYDVHLYCQVPFKTFEMTNAKKNSKLAKSLKKRHVYSGGS